MRAHEIYESKISPIEFCEQTLIGKFGFKESIPGVQFTKFLSDHFYVVVKAHEHSTTFNAYLFNRKTWKTDKEFEFQVNERGANKLLNVITKWTRELSDADPVIESVGSFTAGDPVTYDLQPNKRNSPRGNAVFKAMSSKKNHAYIETETEGTIMVPIAELELRK